MTFPLTSFINLKADKVNEFIDIFHSFFPGFCMLAVFFLLESYLPYKEYFESKYDRFLTYLKIPFFAVLNLTLISQSFFGGCVLFYLQRWIIMTFLNQDLTYKFGLFGREYWNYDYLWLLRVIYFALTFLAVYLTYLFFTKRVLNTKLPALSKS